MDANYAQGRQAVDMVAKLLNGEIPEETLNAHSATRIHRFSTPVSAPLPPADTEAP
jgi:hypothetical protein